jgi:hypothetical protein
MEILWGSATLLESGASVRSPFDDEAVSFLRHFGDRLSRRPDILRRPEIAALASWLRPGNLARLRQFLPDASVRPRGLALHIAPSNMDAMFIYSWVFSLLAGNSNIVRASSTPGEAALALLETLSQLEGYANVAKSNVILTYPRHELELSRRLSLLGDVRLIWGGDATVSTFKTMPTRPLCVDLVFPDRSSACVLEAGHVLAMSDEKLAQTAGLFFRDAYAFEQMACSSPRLVVWVGGGAAEASRRWWAAVNVECERRQRSEDELTAFLKLSLACSASLDQEGSELVSLGSSTVLEVASFPTEHCGGGFFYQRQVPDLRTALAAMPSNLQTVTALGFEGQEVAQSLGDHRVDRIVPFGTALEITPIWDGYSLFDHLTRRVEIGPLRR